ncbi:sodium/potassium-transporting ATPase subunit beta-1 like protein [Danaus plexippus plexippus]|uniref:Sodium/potassium-transporting ATPase subunit beta-1 like protein n=1 Tax=Danaus plexippus plexippus TaxID=278856 RepID=A0A212EHN7_DANPL|nr:sodium/potassium-transporting ATPase subunit beta-1 like protein [Danaus plexippus plexippus]
MFKKSEKKSHNPPSKHPSMPVAGSSKNAATAGDKDEETPSCGQRCCKYLYNRETKQFCGRTCKSWFSIFVYSIMYFIFLSTYTLILLYASFNVIKYMDDYQTIDKIDLWSYSEQGIGLTATPTSLNNLPVVWYRNDTRDYQKYITDLENLINKRRKREAYNTSYADLGPCGHPPFGYGDKPCIIIRINRQLKWSAKPLVTNETALRTVPNRVQSHLKLKKQKLWLHCNGVHSYDKEHIGNIKYYPEPPGFDPDSFPLNDSSFSPLVAIQVSNFTLGLSLIIECKLWYQGGVSSTEFVLYVTPKKK